MYILYKKSKKKKNDKLKMVRWYRDPYIMLTYGVSRPDRYYYYYSTHNDKKNIMKVGE